LCAFSFIGENSTDLGTMLQTPNALGETMPGRIQKTLIQSGSATGAATFYAQDFQTFTLGMTATNGSSPVAAYSVLLYATPTTPDAAAYSYKAQGVAGAVAVFENVADSNGTPFNFYKMVISYSGLTNSGGDAAVFTAVVSAS
jgi:surface antigen